ncbi:hypothetical protein MMC20_003749 [Loxospora ochrophaea]|nr:hypothetical protein [Loxospora ochrophaea]
MSNQENHESNNGSQSPVSPTSPTRRDTGSSSVRTRGNTGPGPLRRASLSFMESSPPAGMWDATGKIAAAIPSLGEIRRGSYGTGGWSGEGQRRNSNASLQSRGQLSRTSSTQSPAGFPRPHRNLSMGPNSPSSPVLAEHESEDDGFPNFFGRGEMSDQSYVRGANRPSAAPGASDLTDPDPDLDDLEDTPRPKRKNLSKFMAMDKARPSSPPSSSPKPSSEPTLGPNADGVYPNGYKYPPKHSAGQATIIGLKAFWKFTLTPLGFCVVVYGLNVVAWGGMLFLLLCNAGPAMCYPDHLHGKKDCNDIDSPRRIWIEIDSQILNALFCVTGFGLVPWRFRDLYYLLKFRVLKQQDALRKLAGIHRGWFRLAGSDRLPPIATEADLDDSNPAVPFPASKVPDNPLTGIRAPATPVWKLDYVIWAYVINTGFQCCLSGFMWGLNRYRRPSWSTGLFVALACIVAALGGLMVFMEGKKVKKVEGIPVEEEALLRAAEAEEEDAELGKRKTVEAKQEKRKSKDHVVEADAAEKE